MRETCLTFSEFLPGKAVAIEKIRKSENPVRKSEFGPEVRGSPNIKKMRGEKSGTELGHYWGVRGREVLQNTRQV